jgi:demethoxyubiquinone hydroxylase (CLK1/Coq7/Cat5 family)/predicted DCC family thiol-disulfide oxidoreductase YuxK
MTQPALTVCFDGSCPLCRREVAMYQRLPADGVVNWLDVSDQTVAATEALIPEPAPSRAELMARFHVRRADGQWLSGAAAFVELWRNLPGWRWLARAAQIPGVLPLMELGYRIFLPLRPRLQAMARRRERGCSHPAQARAVDVLPGSGAVQSPGITSAYPPWLLRELRSDHAGEVGAVRIYDGVLACSRDAAVRAFAQAHRDTERRHLALIEAELAPSQRSRLLSAWRVAGWLTGALPALAGPRAVYLTIAAVERFVDQHYQQQLDAIDALPPDQRKPLQALRQLLADCQGDERHHRDEAQQLLRRASGAPARQGAADEPTQARTSWALRVWCAMVGKGSAAAVVLARRC